MYKIVQGIYSRIVYSVEAPDVAASSLQFIIAIHGKAMNVYLNYLRADIKGTVLLPSTKLVNNQESWLS
jgi:hypothetical protein